MNDRAVIGFTTTSQCACGSLKRIAIAFEIGAERKLLPLNIKGEANAAIMCDALDPRRNLHRRSSSPRRWRPGWIDETAAGVSSQ